MKPQLALLTLLLFLGAAHAQEPSAPTGARAASSAVLPPLAPDIRQALPTPRLVGQHKFTYWGFEVYDARLWSNAAFAPEAWAQQTLVLELRYLRDFQGADIAQRSLDEIQGQRKLSAAQAQDWLLALQTAIPNVRRGERLSGIYRPGKGLVLLHQDRAVGELQDPQLAQRFMGIWLAPETSQRQLRQQLLAGAQ